MTDAAEKSGAEMAADLAKPRELTPHEIAAEKEANEPRSVKAARLIASYEHDLAHGAPRTSTELAELKALLAD